MAILIYDGDILLYDSVLLLLRQEIIQ